MRSVDPKLYIDGETGVVVIGHGSRAPEALVLLNWVADRLAVRLRMPVLAASLQFNKPTLDDCCHELAKAGARRVVVVPYFLYEGNHLKKDIPRELDRLRRELPGTGFVLADSLGADELLVEVLARRMLEKSDVVKTVNDEQKNDGDAADLLAALLGAGCGGEADACKKSAPIVRHPIEVESFEIIDSLLEPADPEDPEYQVVRRIVHTTGDPSLSRGVNFSPGAIASGVAALATGTNIFCDVNMVAVGIRPTAALRGIDVACLVADPETALLSRREGMTRGAAGVRMAAKGYAPGDTAAGAVMGGFPGNNVNFARSGLEGAIVAIGNSPTALFELLRLVDEEGLRPALIVGVPVGFVGATESKEALGASAIPHITLPGNRGGSTVAVAIVNALMRLSA
ncbi:MAG: precorrin-8X methylmutase [Thermoleophilia bacterium]